MRRLLTDLLHNTPRDRLKPLFEADLSSPLQSEDIILLRQLASGDVEPITTRVSVDPIAAFGHLHGIAQTRASSYKEEIIRRCQLFVFHLLKEQFERENIGIKPGAFASVIASRIGEAPAKVLPSVRYWARSGALLHGLVSRLGGLGILFVLPMNVSRSIWESHLNPNVPRYAEAIDHLAASGLCEYADQSGAYKAGALVGERFGLVQVGNLLSFAPGP